MSISLIVVDAANEELSLLNVPVATEEVFQRVWMEGAVQVEARWLPLFCTGVDLMAAEFAAVCRELLAFQAWLERATLEPHERSAIVGRVESLIAALERVRREEGDKGKVFIG